jgi:hypothetical protein
VKLFGKIVLSIPIVGIWLEDYISLFMLLVMLAVLWGVCFAMDAHRAPRRTPIYTIFTFMFLTGWVPFAGLFWLWADVLPFWLCCWSGLFAATMASTVWWICSWIGWQIDKQDPDNAMWAKAGGHYFWDTLPPFWNPDSDLIRAGGFPEPTYTSFVPPSDWPFQCPRCHVRLQHNPDVCWNCNYGADGDSSAYYEVYGHIDPPTSAAS